MPADAAASSPSVPDLQQRIEMLEADLRARTAERNEAVEQQAATTEVLRVINASAGNLQPVFDTIVEHAMTLCDAAFGMFGTFDGQHLQTVATRGVPEAFVQFRLSNPPEYGTETGPGRLIAGEAYVHDIDVADSEAYRIGDPNRRAIVDLGGARTILSVALRDDEALLGTLSVYRQEVRPFSDNQIALLKRFADQAVIAMKNAHLLEEQREALAQQTATVEVLRVINSSPANLDPVFGAMLESATRLCNAAFGILWLCEGESFHAAALHGVPERYADIARVPVRPRPNNPLGRMLRGERVIVSLDAADDELYRAGDPVRRALVDAGGARSFIQVALVKDETLLGSLTVYRTEVRAFSEKQITMLKSFAAQAVIAIENARLLSELRHRTDDLTESLEYQTATSEVLDAIGRSTSNIQPVLDKMLSAALRLCRTESGGIAVQQGGVFRYIAILGWDPEADKAFRSMEITPGRGTVAGRALADGRVVQVEDVASDPEFERPDMAKLSRWHTALGVPLMRGGRPIGAIAITRDRIEPFTERQIALVRTFADQAVIAMENARLLGELRQRTNDLTETLEYQTAISELLEVISRSRSELQPVLDTLLASAARLCGTDSGGVALRRNKGVSYVASFGQTPDFDKMWRMREFLPDQTTVTGRVLSEKKVVHVTDMAADTGHSLAEAVTLGGMRTALGVPLLLEGEPLGLIMLNRDHVEPFSDRQIALVRTFADQAVIAVENARLLGELRQRTDDLTESLEYQTATSDVLQVISRSTFDLQPVLDTLSATAARLCGAELSFMTRRDGDAFRFVTAVGATSETTSDAIRLKQEVLDQHLFRPGRDTITGRVVAEQGVVQIVDLAADAEYALTALTTVGKIKTLLGVPLMREGEVIGTMSLARQRVEPFTNKQIQLVRTFADQAVIAMENARLITEQREALARQQATSEVLQVINSSLGQVAPVFDALLEKATSLCEAAFGILWTYDGENFHAAAFREVPPAYAEYLRNPPPLTPETPLGRIAAGESVVHILDLAAQALEHNPLLRQAVELGGFRTILGVALRKEGTLLGAITIYRQEIRQFSDKQVALLQNFAAQAVIAMDNARLLGEQREALEQQTATAEVLQVINSSPGNLGPVFEAMLDKALNLCSAAFGVLWTYDGEYIHAAAIRGATTVYTEFLTSGPHRPGDTLHGRLLRGSEVEHIADMADSDDYRSGEATPRALVDLGGGRSRLAVALRKEGVFLGDIVIYRREVRPFSDKEIALLQNFAAQAVIAMENARLLTEQREALDQQTATAEVLQVINSSPGDIVPVFATILEKAHALCGVAYGSLQLYDGEKFRAVAVHGLPQALADLLRDGYVPGPTHPVRPLLAGEDSVQIPDMAGMGDASSVLRTSGLRTALFVALRKDDLLLGQIVAARDEIRPFTDKETSLLQNFAQHAVIAIENARLLGELRESLDQQTATAEVLQVISTSPGELHPVFEAILANAGRLCAAQFGSAGLRVEGGFHFHATLNMPSAFIDYLRANDPLPIVPGGAIEHMDRTGQVVHIADLQRDTGPGSRSEQRRVLAEAVGAKTMLWVPMLREGRVVGIINLFRTEVAPFSDQQIELVRGFAAQAVIAIENARLLNEVRRREQELSVTFEHMGDGVVMFDADQKLASWNRNFQELLDMPDAFLASRPPRDDYVRLLARRGELGERDVEKEVARYRDRATRPWSAERTRPDGRVLEVRNNPVPGGGAVLIYSDITERKKAEAEIAAARDAAEAALERQTATADILKVIASSPSDVQPVFDAIAARSNQLISGRSTAVYRLVDDVLYLMSMTSISAEADASLKALFPMPLSRSPSFQETIRTREVQRVSDVELEFTETPDALAMARLRGWRSLILVPLMQDGEPIGVISVTRAEPGLVADEHVELLKTFADQAVIAIRNARLFSELREALEQQTATAEILRVISQSPTDVQPVLEAVTRAALRFCGAPDAIVLLRDGDDNVVAAHEGTLTATLGLRRPIAAANFSGQAMLEGRTLQIADVDALDPAVYAGVLALARQHKWRASAAAPMLHGGKAIGCVVLRKPEPGLLSSRQTALLETFAAQAVIAIENVRLFTELRDSLEQQTATAEILTVISQSPTDVGPVLSAVAKAAMKFCGANDALVSLRDGDEWFIAAHEGPIETMIGTRRMLTRHTAPGRAMTDGKVVQIVDLQSDEGDEFPEGREIGARTGFRSALAAPLQRDDASIGAISLRRREAGEFEPRQVELLKTFAAQAVIAIENVRLFTELRESLEQQTASAEILEAISQSPTDVEPVLKAVVGAARRFCGADDAMVVLREETEQLLATHEGSLLSLAGTRFPLDRSSATGRAIIDGQTFHVPDVASLDPVEHAMTIELTRRTGVRALLAAPMLREGQAIGCLLLRRPTPGAFTTRQIELLETFAAQAVIAIENVRLFTELRESLEQQTASAEILKVISESPTDVEPVLKAVAAAARRFCNAHTAGVILRDGAEIFVAASEGPLDVGAGGRRFPLHRGTVMGRSIVDGHSVHVPDMQAVDPDEYPLGRSLSLELGHRATLAAPLMSEGFAIGCILLRKPEPSGFTVRQIELVETFAAQAVIAIQNVRLFTELRDSLERLKAAQANLIQAEKMASLGQLTAGIAHEIKNPLNFVNNFAGLSGELVKELEQGVEAMLAEPDDDKRAELQETMGLLTGNLAKIVEHGRRADGIVKSMLAHSRGGTGDWQTTNINGLVEEALNLAYHGARAQDQNFNVTLERAFDEALKPFDVVPQDVTRVFLNLIGNGFYATRKRQRDNGENGYQPTLKVSTHDLGEAVEVRVRDNGIGIAPEVLAKLFQPFFTTKPTGEGTGLGLSISYDIVTQQHGGLIEVESEVGQFTEFIVRLPRARRAASRGS